MSDETIKISIDAARALVEPGGDRGGHLREAIAGIKAALAEHDRGRERRGLGLPWRESYGTLTDSNGDHRGQAPTRVAPFIATACNAHHQLVDALRVARKELVRWGDAGTADVCTAALRAAEFADE